jgi:hypothetical protein
MARNLTDASELKVLLLSAYDSYFSYIKINFIET